MIRVIDFETTGMAPPAQVIEVGYCDFDPVSREVIGGDSYLCGGVEAIPAETRAVHHIRLDQLAGCAPYDRRLLFEYAVRSSVYAFAAHKADFEAQWIMGDIPMICTYKAALRVWPDAPTHSNFGLLYWLEDQGLFAYEPLKAQPAHRSLPDAYVTAIVLGAMFRAGAVGRDMMEWTRAPALLPRCPIGEHRGKPWADVDHGFLVWMTRQRDMDSDLKWNAEHELERRRPR